MNIGKKIRELRKERELTQGELARMIDSDTRQISMYESKKYSPSAEVVVKLANALGVSTDYLLMDNAPKVVIPKVKDKELLKQVETIDKFNEIIKDAVRLILSGVILEQKLGGMVKPELSRQRSNVKKKA